MWLTVALVVLAVIVLACSRWDAPPPDKGSWMGMDFGVMALWWRFRGRE